MIGEQVRARQVSQWDNMGAVKQGREQVDVVLNYCLGVATLFSDPIDSQRTEDAQPPIAWQGFRFIRTAHPRESAACHKVPSKAASLAEFYECAPLDSLPPNTI